MLMLAYYAGGYVAGRMARFNGPRQGVADPAGRAARTWRSPVAGMLLGAEYNVPSSLSLLRISVDEGSLTTGGLIALTAVLAARCWPRRSGKAGRHYHRKVHRVGL